jgi:hypothetical protein
VAAVTRPAAAWAAAASKLGFNTPSFAECLSKSSSHSGWTTILTLSRYLDSHSLANRIRNTMFTYMAIVALTSSISTANLSPNPTWFNDYATAARHVADVHKPMAVFVGNGQEGWGKVIREGTLDDEMKRLLARKFVCVYVDRDTAAGRSLAGSFEVASRGLIISDRVGTSQAYSLSGDLTGSELVKTLEKYADADVRTTETLVREVPAARPVTYQTYTPQYRVSPRYTSGST